MGSSLKSIGNSQLLKKKFYLNRLVLIGQIHGSFLRLQAHRFINSPTLFILLTGYFSRFGLERSWTRTPSLNHLSDLFSCLSPLPSRDSVWVITPPSPAMPALPLLVLVGHYLFSSRTIVNLVVRFLYFLPHVAQISSLRKKEIFNHYITLQVFYSSFLHPFSFFLAKCLQ